MDYFIEQTEIFEQWLESMRDIRAKAAIVRRISRVRSGHFGDYKSIGNGVSEMRIDIGQGYRVYFTIRERTVVFLLNGGDKSGQQSDIKRAFELAREV